MTKIYTVLVQNKNYANRTHKIQGQIGIFKESMKKIPKVFKDKIIFSGFKEYSRNQYIFKDFSRLVQTMAGRESKLTGRYRAGEGRKGEGNKDRKRKNDNRNDRS